jgi:hypothetical protein
MSFRRDTFPRGHSRHASTGRLMHQPTWNPTMRARCASKRSSQELPVPLRLSSLCLGFATLGVFRSGNFNFDSTLVDAGGSLRDNRGWRIEHFQALIHLRPAGRSARMPATLLSLFIAVEALRGGR